MKFLKSPRSHKVFENSNFQVLNIIIIICTKVSKNLENPSRAKKLTSIKIVLITNFLNSVNGDQVEAVIAGLNEMNIELIAFNDDIKFLSDHELFGTFSQSQVKSQSQKASEDLFARVIRESRGNLCHIEYVEVQLLHFQKKTTRPMPWNCSLTIGSQIKIPISAFIRVQEEKFLGSFKTECTIPNSITKPVIEYTQGNQVIQQLDPEEVVKGYNYGESVIPVPDDSAVVYRNKEKCFSCIGFAQRSSILDEHLIGDSSSVVVPQAGSDERPFSCLVRAMAESEMCMIVRRVYRLGLNPTLNVLIPHFNGTTIAYLTMIQLPFAEDEISFMFPQLRGSKTKPSDEQLEAMENLIDSMDLMTALDDESGLQEAFDTKKTLNPLHQHVCRSICHRALNPTSELSNIEEELLKIIDVPEQLKESSQEIMEKLKELFELEEVVIPVKKIFPVSKTGDDEEDEPLDEDLLDPGSRSNIVEVGTVTPAEDFHLLMKKGEHFGKVAGQIANVIYDLIFRTTNLQLEKVMSAIHVFRGEAKQYGPFHYNEWIRKLKEALLSRNRVSFWEDVIVKDNYGLISETESSLSSISEEVQKEFYKAALQTNANEPMMTADDDDDLDMLLND